MSVREQAWVTVQEASDAIGVPLATIREWYRGGLIESQVSAGGQRLVPLQEVEDRATGIRRDSKRGDKSGPPRTAEQLEADVERESTLSRAVVELQGMARARLEPDPE
jgi:hypothetical protein